jgi:hypothetical protein
MHPACVTVPVVRRLGFTRYTYPVMLARSNSADLSLFLHHSRAFLPLCSVSLYILSYSCFLGHTVA